MSIHDEIQELIPAYVLDAVDASERARVEQHVPQCTACAGVVAFYQQVSESLALAVSPVEPPPDLKPRVLAAALPKVTPQADPAPSFIARVGNGLSGVLRSPAFSAVALLLIIALGAWDLSLENQISQQAASNAKMFADLSRQREFMVAMAYANGQPKELWGTQVASRAVGRLYGSANETTLALVALDMPVLPAGKVYQIWLLDSNGDRTSGGTFTVDDQGRGWLIIRVPKPLGNYQGVGITMEPEGGSPAPTGEKMLGTTL